MPLAGIDVSHFNGEVDWTAAASSITFAFAKATQGIGYVDPRFAQNWRAMGDAGVQRGAYHFFDPTENAVAQAEHFLNTVRLDADDLPPVLDIEMLKRSTRTSTLDGITAWLAAVQSGAGRTPIIYTSPGFWAQLGNPPNPGQHPLWVAHYGVAKPSVPPIWESWTFWQFSQLGRCAGIKGYVDLNRFSGSSDDLKAMACENASTGYQK